LLGPGDLRGVTQQHENDVAPASGARAVFRNPSYRRATVILLVAMALAGLFVTSYVDALGRPTARALRIAVVGADPGQDAFARALQAGTAKGVRYERYPTQAAAEAAVARQRDYAVLVLGTPGKVALELSTASGSSVSRILPQVATPAATRSGVQVQLRDLHPLPASDPSGLAEFYLTLAATILGFVTTFQLRANARPLSLRAWFGFTGALVVLGSLVLVSLTTALLHVPIPFLHAWLLVGLQMATASAFAATMAVLIGRWALLPTWLLFVVLGNTSSGGAVASPLLPEPLRALSRTLPSGATVSSLRSAAYFPHDQPLEPQLVLTAWAVAAVAALLLVGRLLGRTPGDE
jgi:hypothetical protein